MMFIRNVFRGIKLLTFALASFLTMSCLDMNYLRQEQAGNQNDALALEGEAWTLSSTAKPYFLPDDPLGNLGRAAMYSYAHNARGQRLSLQPGEIRGVFQTSRGSVISICLGVHVRPNGQLYSFILVCDFTDRDNASYWTYKTDYRGSDTKQNHIGGTLTISIYGSPSGTKIEVRADEIRAEDDILRVTLDDLYRWRQLKVQGVNINSEHEQLKIGPAIYIQLPGAVDTDDQNGGGLAYFKKDTLLGDNPRLEPIYAVQLNTLAGNVAGPIPIGDSGHILAWDPVKSVYIIDGKDHSEQPVRSKNGVGTEAHPASVPNLKSSAGTMARTEGVSRGFYTLEKNINFNVLDRVIFDPLAGRITLTGHQDPRLGGMFIPYLDYLAELLKNPSPELTLNWTPESLTRIKTLFQNFDSDQFVKGLIRQWTDIMDANGHPTGQGRWLLPLIGVKPTAYGERIGYLGVNVQELNQQSGDSYDERLLITAVTPGSPAEREGLRRGDVIINYANAAAFQRNIRLIGEGGSLTLQIWREGHDLSSPIKVTLGGMDGDPWAEIDKFDIVQNMLWAAGKNKAGILINCFADVYRQVRSGSKAGFQKTFSILVAAAGFNDPYWQDVGEYRAGRMSQDQVLGHAYRAIFSAIEDALGFGGQPLTSAFDAALRRGADSSDAFDRTLVVFNEQIVLCLEQLMETLLAKNEEIQIPPEVMLQSIGPQVEVTPEFRGVDPHSALALFMYNADVLGKSLIDKPSLAQKIPGYQSDFAFEREHPDRAGPWHASADYHLWYSIDSVDVARSQDGQTLYMRGAKIRFNIREKAPDGTDLPAVAGGYEELLTSLYDKLAVEFPALHELREVAKLTAAAEWLKFKKPDLKLPDAGRISASVQERTPGMIDFTWSPKERPGRLAAALTAIGGVTLKLKPSSLDLIRRPREIIGVAEDGSILAVDPSEKATAISKILGMPVGAPGPQPVGWVTTDTENGQIGSAVSFLIPPVQEELPVSMPLQCESFGQTTMIWKPDSFKDAKKLSEEHVQKDLEHYHQQLGKIIDEVDRIYVPKPGVIIPEIIIEEGVILGPLTPESEARELIGKNSPFSGKPYMKGEVFATPPYEDPNMALQELLINNSSGEFTLNTPRGKELIEKLEGKHFKRLLTHSIGATVAEALIKKSVIQVDELNVLGGDRADVNKAGFQELIDSGKVKRVVVWDNPGDIIPKGSSCVLPTPVNMTGSIPAAAIAGNIATGDTGMSQGEDKIVKYITLVGSQYKGQEIREDDFKDAETLLKALQDAHAFETYRFNIAEYFKAASSKLK